MQIYGNKKDFAWEKSSALEGLSWHTNMAAVSLFWNTNMAAVTSCENALLSVFTHVAEIYANLFEQKKAFS